jgi:hypothetical protein
MLAFSQDNGPFSFERLLSLPAFLTQPSSGWQILDLNEHLFDGVFKQPDAQLPGLQELHTNYFHLQSQNIPLPEIESPSVSSAPSEFEETHAADVTSKEDPFDYDEDIWTLPDIARPKISATLTSWDSFLQPSYLAPRATYLSEAGPRAFDAALDEALRKVGKSLPSKVARPDKLIFSLFELGSGRQSGLFQWDDLNQTFVRRSEEFGLLETSQNVQEAYIENFISIGNTVRGLRDLVEENIALLGSQRLATALWSALSVVLLATARFLERERRSVQSLLQLQELFHKPRLLFESLNTIATIVKSEANASKTVARLINEAQQLSSGATWLEDVLSEVVLRTATPWVKTMANVVGLSHLAFRESAPNDDGGAVTRETGSMHTILSHVLPKEIARLVGECETSLRLLQVHEPDHPLLASAKADKWPSLSWDRSWEAIEKLQHRANTYERSLKEAIEAFARGSFDPEIETEAVIIEVGAPAQKSVAQDADTRLVDLESTTRWNLHLGMRQAMEDDDKLDSIVSTALTSDEGCLVPRTPQLNEALTLSISPLLKAQHRLLSCSVLHLLFKKHGFRSHLRLHHQFQLLADGSFAARLSQALFDPNQSSGEGQRKGQGKPGLRLQTRNTWPPASSELRLVLVGILSESFVPEHAKIPAAKGRNLSDSMSFAIRDLSDGELEKCRDADSIHALDFLRLQYNPPSALLGSVLTPSSQRKYDGIFKHLLRLLRIRNVALTLIRDVSGRRSNSIPRSDHRFRIEIQFFISTLAEYTANFAIRVAWTGLQDLVDKVERCLDCNDFDGAVAMAGGLQRLTDMHDEALESMLRALFLDKKQVPARTLLEDIFGLILRFAAMVRADDATTKDDNEKARTMYKEFRKQVGRFTRYLRAQSDASTSRSSAGNGEALAFAQLLVRLNLFGNYS